MKYFIITILYFLLSATIVVSQTPQGMQVNDMAPDFIGKDQNDKTISLKAELQKGYVVLVFYRGEWCPYCNRYLKELEESLGQIAAKGATVIAVTPEVDEYIDMSIEKTNASFSILHDEGLKIMKSYDVAYQLDDKTVNKYKKFKIDLNVINGPVNSTSLPVPAVYVINKQGKIVYKFFDPDYSVRAPVKTILEYCSVK
jgi:peroxiredoxin